jgi:hypothetical protein
MCKIKCAWKTCKNHKAGYCNSEDEIELVQVTYEDEEGEEKDGLQCTGYDYDRDWMCRPRAV